MCIYIYIYVLFTHRLFTHILFTHRLFTYRLFTHIPIYFSPIYSLNAGQGGIDTPPSPMHHDTQKTTKGHTLITTYLHLFTKFLHAHQALPPGLSNPTSFALDNFSLAFGWLSYWYVRLVFGDGASCCARLLSHLYCGVGGGGLGWWVGSENIPVYMHTDTYTHSRSFLALAQTHTHTHWMLRHSIFSCTCTHLKDRISSMSLFIPERVPELFMLFTCIVQEGRLCPHWTKVADVGKY